MNGHAVQIITVEDEHVFKLDEDALEEILLDDRIRDKHVVVVSVAGAFRKGKSFLLDFFIRFLETENRERWLGDEQAPLTGFSWRGGSERDTTGILLWSEPFLQRLPSGEEVAILLMDTQGAFDSESTVKDCATVFALSTMLSSVQVFNLSQNIQEDDLQHLQLFTEYGRLALEEDTTATPFQKLLFLVRDWSFPYEQPYGTDGGLRILDRRLTISDRQHPELQQLRRHIRACFRDISCYLMPHPGLKVATDPTFKGHLKDIEPVFKEQLNILVPSLLAKENLVVKEINGSKVTSKQLMEYFRVYVEIYQGDTLPEPKSMLHATAEANNLAAAAEAKDRYIAAMESSCGGDRPYMNSAQLYEVHYRHKDQAIDVFKSTRKMGGDEFSQAYLERLEKEIEETYENYVKHNDSKNVFKQFRTPAVLFCIMFAFYVLSVVFGTLALYPLANFCNLMIGVTLIMLALWAYVRYSGDFRELGAQIDVLTNIIWFFLLRPVYFMIGGDRSTYAQAVFGEDENSRQFNHTDEKVSALNSIPLSLSHHHSHHTAPKTPTTKS